MPRGTDWFNFIYVTISYIIMSTGLMAYISLQGIYLNWPKYRCNPLFMPFSKDVKKDFAYCVQNMQMVYMGTLLQPIWWLISNISNMSVNLFGSLQMFREFIANIRSFIANIITTIIGFIFNFVIQAQKMAIAIKDMVGKIVGIMLTCLYLMDGTMKTMMSAWNGPPGQMTRALCFKNDTLVKMKDGELRKMQDISLGDVLDNGSKVNAVLKVANANNEAFYRMKSTTGGTDVFVTGSHYVLHETTGKYVKAKNHPNAELTNIVEKTFSCLITDDHLIPVEGYVFWDWEDDILTNKE